MKRIAGIGTGFIYVVSVTGVTGERSSFDAALGDTISRLRKGDETSAGYWFWGCRLRKMQRKPRAWGDGAVVASAVIKAMENDGLDAGVSKAKELIDAVHELEG